MSMTDPIADMLTRIRNANNAGHKTVEIPASNEKRAILKILLDEGYIKKTEKINPYVSLVNWWFQPLTQTSLSVLPIPLLNRSIFSWRLLSLSAT